MAFPRPNIALIATHSGYLRTLLGRMGGTPTGRALPPNLMEWKYVDTKAAAWGLRHYRRDGADLDPTSPFQQQGPESDPGAIGITVAFSAGAQHTATVAYLSTGAGARRILTTFLMMEDAATAAPRELKMTLRRPAAGVVEATVDISRTEPLFRLFFGITALLGHAVAL